MPLVVLLAEVKATDQSAAEGLQLIETFLVGAVRAVGVVAV